VAAIEFGRRAYVYNDGTVGYELLVVHTGTQELL
jgi:hypothetical protein